MLADLDIYNVKGAFERINAWRDLAAATMDPGFLRHARRALLPLPTDRPYEPPARVFPAFRHRPLRALRGKRVAVVASGGAGACVSLVGAARALEEAGVEPAFISACSGGAIWSGMWATGASAEEMAAFSLSMRPEDYLDVQWAKLPRFALAALRGFSGLMKGAALERLFEERFGRVEAGRLAIPLQTIVYDMDRGVVDYFGSRTTPELPLGRLVRIAVALPVFIEAVPVRGHLYVDGGIIELFPVEPVLAAGPFDHVIGLNFMLPAQLVPRDLTGWQDRPLGILEASRQLQQGYHLEFARRARRELGDALTIVDVADQRLCRGVAFYDLFIDRSRWPQLMAEGYRRTRLALDGLRGAGSRAAA